jgi:hypothetical protein
MFKQHNKSRWETYLIRVLIVGALVLGWSGLTNAASADGPITPEFFAMDDGGVTSPNRDLMVLARATGAPYLRMALYWKHLEPSNTTPENYNWEYADLYFARAFNADITPLVYITENPAWAANTACGPIDTTNETLRAEFGQFMSAIAARYPQIKRWGLYNESDGSSVLLQTGGCFGDDDTGDLNANGVPDYAEYAEMAGIARDAVHQANPDAQVYIAVAFDDFDIKTCPPNYTCLPPSHFDYNFLPNLFGYMASHPRANGQPYADALTFTYYDIYGPYWERQPSGAGWHGIQAKAAAIQKRMNDAGVSFPMFVTETGDDSQAGWIGADGQSRCLTISYVRGLAISLQMIVWWTFVDNPNKNWYYGLVDTNKNVKPSYGAFQTLFGELNGWTYVKPWTKNDSIEGYLFTDGVNKKWVVWSNLAQSDGKSPCAYPRAATTMNFKAKRLRVTDLYDNAKIIRDNRKGDLNPLKGRMRISLDGSPQYVVPNP